MKRRNETKIDGPEYMDDVWRKEELHRFDAVRLRALLRYIRPGQRVLDVGSGRYGALEYLAWIGDPKLAASLDITAVDHSRFALDWFESVMPPAVLCLPHDLEQPLPFPDAHFDYVIAGEIIEHMESPADFAANLARVIAPRGWLTLTTLNHDCEQAQLREYPEHLWELDGADLLSLFGPHGRVVYERVGNYHYLAMQRMP